MPRGRLIADAVLKKESTSFFECHIFSRLYAVTTYFRYSSLLQIYQIHVQVHKFEYTDRIIASLYI